MLSSRECLEKADRLREMARHCRNECDRQAFVETATEWRQMALIARHQTAWEAAVSTVIQRLDDD